MCAVVQTNQNIADMLAHLGLIWKILSRGQIRMTQGGKKSFTKSRQSSHLVSLPLKVISHIFRIAASPLKWLIRVSMD